MNVLTACRTAQVPVGRCNRYRGDKGGLLRLTLCLVRSVGLALRLALVLLAVLGLSLALLVAHRWMIVSPFFALKSIEVTGNYQLGHDEIAALAGVGLGQNCLNLNMRKIEQGLRTNPWVQGVVVQRILPNRLVIQVTEREPAFWVRSGGRLFYAGVDGKPIAPVELKRFVSLPLLMLGPPTDFKQEVLSSLREKLEQKRLPFSLAEVDWVRFVSEEVVEVYLGGRDMSLRIGASKLDGSLGHLNALWDDLENRGELGRVRTVRMRGDKAWVRWTGDGQP